MTALDELIAAVEAGAISTDLIRGKGILDNEWDEVFVLSALNGSLDGAKELHDALLPGWMWNVECGADAIVWDGKDPSVQNYGIGIGDCPARAWLLAILRAKRAMGE